MDKQNNDIKKINSTLPVVVLFGRTNVGKSTLFNKLAGQAHALVSKVAGTTRDLNRATVEWQNATFQLIDTGGVEQEKFLAAAKEKKTTDENQNLDALVQTHAVAALKKAEVIIFMVDAKNGALEQDRRFALALKKIRQKNQRVLIVANKADTAKDRLKCAEFYTLGLGEPLPVSAASGSGTGDLLDVVVRELQKMPPKHELPLGADRPPIRVVIIGKPNVGKSSLLNALMNEDAVIVSPLPHTTREPQDITIVYRETPLTFVDTAGIVKAQSKALQDNLIKAGIGKSLSALKKADIALLMIDIAEELSHQETKLADEILQSGVSVIIVANKWDNISDKDTKTYTRAIYSTLPFVQWAPIVFLSAKNKTKLSLLMDTILAVARARNTNIPEEKLNMFLSSALRHAAPLSRAKVRGILKNKLPKPQLKKIVQIKTNPPVFHLVAKAKLGVKDNYIAYLENRLRKEFKLLGTPVRIGVEEK
jgi:GTP-binding protein